MQPKSLFYVALVAAALLAFGTHAELRAQGASAPSASKSEVYFGLRTSDGRSVAPADWEKFLGEVVAPRFPAGLTVLDASGRSAGAAAALNPTRILVLVHPAGEEAQKALREIKAEYRKRFGAVGIFHTEQAVRIVAD